MFSLGGGEIILILVIAAIFIGPKDVPKVARQVGTWYRQLRLATNDIKETVEREIEKEDKQKLE